MDTATFWQLVDKTREASQGDSRLQHDLLVEDLAQLSEDEILSFDNIFDDLRDKAYRADLWDAAYLIDAGCSDDGFSEFREWLIGRGKEVYDKALADPESLVDVIEPGSEKMHPTLLGVADDAYERVTGKEDMPFREKPQAELKGAHLPDDEAIKARFPKLTAKYWSWWMKYHGLEKS